MWPAQTASKHIRTDTPTFPAASAISPSLTRLSVCRLKDEKVV